MISYSFVVKIEKIVKNRILRVIESIKIAKNDNFLALKLLEGSLKSVNKRVTHLLFFHLFYNKTSTKTGKNSVVKIESCSFKPNLSTSYTNSAEINKYSNKSKRNSEVLPATETIEDFDQTPQKTTKMTKKKKPLLRRSKEQLSKINKIAKNHN